MASSTEIPRHATLYPDRGTGIRWLGMAPFVAVHLLGFGAIWSGVTLSSVIVCFALYYIRMFFTTAAYHRYFAHRTFKTSRLFQFFLAFMAETSSQKGILWWASHHRAHHKYSDTEWDLHSPRQKGFWYAHMLWIYDHTDATDVEGIRDFARYPELRFLNRFWALPPTLMGIAVDLLWGAPGLFIGFFASTAILWHGTFTINSLAHVIGKRRFETTDDSKNHWLLALITCGEGWHNNHHHYQSSTRQGFYWWEIDVTYYALKLMSWLGLVWDLREPPAALLAEGRARDAGRFVTAEVNVASTSEATVGNP